MRNSFEDHHTGLQGDGREDTMEVAEEKADEGTDSSESEEVESQDVVEGQEDVESQEKGKGRGHGKRRGRGRGRGSEQTKKRGQTKKVERGRGQGRGQVEGRSQYGASTSRERRQHQLQPEPNAQENLANHQEQLTVRSIHDFLHKTKTIFNLF